LKPAAALKPVQTQPCQGLLQEFTDLQLVAFPGSWEVGQTQQGGGIYIVPEGGAKQSQEGGVELIWGGLVDYSGVPGDSSDLKTATDALLQAT